MPRWKYAFDAIDPTNPPERWEVGIPEETFRRISNHGHEKMQARILNVYDVLEQTAAIRRGWNRQGHEDCWIYIGRPQHDHHKLPGRFTGKIEVPAPPGMVFLVFVFPDGEIDDWTWRKFLDGDITRPEGAVGELVWQRESN